MKKQLLSLTLGVIVAISSMLMITPTKCGIVSEAGTKDVPVSVTVSDADTTWFKVGVPMDVTLSYDADATDSNRFTGSNGVVYTGVAGFVCKGRIPAGKIVTVAASDATLVGATDATKSMPCTCWFRHDTGDMAWFPTDTPAHSALAAVAFASADYVNDSYTGAIPFGVKITEVNLDDAKVMGNFEAISQNPVSQTYNGNMTFTIDYIDVA